MTHQIVPFCRNTGKNIHSTMIDVDKKRGILNVFYPGTTNYNLFYYRSTVLLLRTALPHPALLLVPFPPPLLLPPPAPSATQTAGEVETSTTGGILYTYREYIKKSFRYNC